MSLSKSLFIGIAVSAVWTFGISNARAGITNVSVTRRIEASSGNYQTPYMTDNGPRLARSFAGPGVFDESLRSSYFRDGSTVAGAVSQHSTVTETSVRVDGTGTVSAGDGPAEYRSLLDLTFDAVGTTFYDLDAAFRFTRLTDSFFRPDINLFSVTLRRTGPTSATLVEGHWSDTQIAVENQRPEVVSSGILEAGRYELQLEVHGFRELAGHDEVYSLNFATSAVPSAVPLPTAAWMGLLTLGGIAGSRVWAARRARACVAGL
jgi:hypothetical protein